MPSRTLPTGTVSRQSRGARTFPPDSEDGSARDDPGAGYEVDGGAAAVVDASERRTAGARANSPPRSPAVDESSSGDHSTTARAPSAADPAHAESPASARDRVAALERENAKLVRENRALRERLRRKRDDLQDVIDRYEQLLASARPGDADSSARGTSDSLSRRATDSARQRAAAVEPTGLLDRLLALRR
jgi:hypothetical protein